MNSSPYQNQAQQTSNQYGQYPPQNPNNQQQYPPDDQQQFGGASPAFQGQPQQQYQQQYPPSNPQQYPPQNYQQYAQQQKPVYEQKDEPKNPFLEDQTNQLEFVGFDERKGFVIKVYGLLSLQLFVTFLFCVIAYVSAGFRDSLIDPYTYNATAFFWVCFIVSFITEIAIFCCKKVARKSPQNFIALSIFTITFSLVVAGCCAVCYDAFSNGGSLVLVAAGLTFAVTGALTCYAWTTKTDFTMKGGAIWIIAITLLVVSICSIFLWSIFWQLLICGLVIICYGFYLIYDTQLIMGGKSHQLSIDDFVIATMFIYIDIIIIFLRILQILMILFGKK